MAPIHGEQNMLNAGVLICRQWLLMILYVTSFIVLADIVIVSCYVLYILSSIS